jgi:hypothetical protein
MKSEFIPYEQALELKKLGFDEQCFGEWQNLKIGKNLVVDEEDRIYDISVLGADIKAPLYQQAFRWFREKYELIFHIECDYNSFLGYKDGYIPIYSLYPFSHDCYKTYEEAELACLKKLIEIVKNK